ncbi:ATP-dependent nuclease [Aeromonas piscicola]|uniref:ATP-dependent nuclease n=1 Tax=Aeromonas piscicola TaxID=600645 RepID=UPI0021F8DFE7|nr:ATP-binding protein [Aeromonas piscicola]MCW0506938.1 ATP-binding protein [Aeromonas piscicola]
MNFTILQRNEKVPSNGANHAYLTIDHWNDFSFVTMFYLSILDENGALHKIGNIKIAFKGQTTDTPTYKKIDCEFSKLTPDFFSVGEDVNFYKELSKLNKDTVKDILTSLNDIALNQDIIINVKDEEVFSVSLLRDSSLTSIKGQYARVLDGKPKLTNFEFSFKRSDTHDIYPIELKFNVEASSTPSSNIHALIGRNGSGKTTILNGMIEAITTNNKKCQLIDHSSWLNEPIDSDYFSSLISVSFSAFDPFSPPIEQPDPSKGTCYFYVGLKDQAQPDKHRTLLELRCDFVKSLTECYRIDKLKTLWFNAIGQLETDVNFASMDLSKLFDIYSNLKIEIKDKIQVDSKEFRALFHAKITNTLEHLSSGHAIVLFTITKIISTIEEKTLILLDEPEGHLHPPLLSAFIRTLSELLFEQNGVAIIATHSPVVLQEVPRTCVWKINRVGDVIVPYRLDIETFGENVGVLTKEVFGLEVETSGYHSLLSKSVARGMNYQEVLMQYSDQLGMEARSVLKSMIINRDRGM